MSLLSNLLVGGAGYAQGYGAEKDKQYARLQELKKQLLEAKTQQDAHDIDLMNAQTNAGYKDIQGHHLQTQDLADYGDVVVPGGLDRYKVDAPANAQADARQFLLDHPDFKSATTRMTPRDKTPAGYYSYLTGQDGGKPLDLANLRVNFIKGIMAGPGGTLPASYAQRAATADSLASDMGLGPLLHGDLQTPTRTVGGVVQGETPPQPKVKVRVGGTGDMGISPAEKNIMSLINSDKTSTPQQLLQEFDNDVRKRPEAFKTVNIARVRQAIQSRGKKGTK